MALKTYDPKQVTIIVGGFIMSGFADGTFVTVERNEDAFALHIGSDGEGTRAKSNNKSGRISLTLAQSSESNEVLSAFAAADELGNSGVVPVLVKDASGKDIHAAETAWIVKVPAAAYGREVDNREWVLETDNLVMFLGGN